VPRIGLALGGGGARGLAHVLILETLDEMGIQPSVIAGTSIGALIGSAYAAGISGAHIRAHLIETLGDRFYLIRQVFGARTQPVQRLLSVLPMRSALLDSNALLDLVMPHGMPNDIADLEIPFRAVATNMRSQKAAVFDRGELKSCVAASIAIPVLFAPVTIDGHLYADGGLVNPLPINALAPLADITIGVDVTGKRDDTRVGDRPSVGTMLVQSLTILQKTIISEHLKVAPPDIYMDVDVGHFGALQFNRVKEILTAVEPVKEELRAKLERVLSAQTVKSS